ncbi:MAG: hypothetical protein M3460_23965 [Actinomycetota bacterium]|nr:hypothetical protein [Actinomycetota bacterium]
MPDTVGRSSSLQTQSPKTRHRITYLAQRITAGDSRATEADLTWAAAALPTHNLLAWSRSWITRRFHLLAHGKNIDNVGGRHRPPSHPPCLPGSP